MSWKTKGLGILALGALFAGPMVPSLAAQRVLAARTVVRTRVIVPPSRVVVAPRVWVAPYGYYSSGWYGYYEPRWYYPYGPVYYNVPSNTGEVKINTSMKDASVYVDGGYVGPIGKFKKFSLKPGNHDIELRDNSGREIFNRRIQVIVNKSVEIKPPA